MTDLCSDDKDGVGCRCDSKVDSRRDVRMFMVLYTVVYVAFLRLSAASYQDTHQCNHAD